MKVSLRQLATLSAFGILVLSFQNCLRQADNSAANKVGVNGNGEGYSGVKTFRSVSSQTCPDGSASRIITTDSSTPPKAFLVKDNCANLPTPSLLDPSTYEISNGDRYIKLADEVFRDDEGTDPRYWLVTCEKTEAITTTSGPAQKLSFVHIDHGPDDGDGQPYTELDYHERIDFSTGASQWGRLFYSDDPVLEAVVGETRVGGLGLLLLDGLKVSSSTPFSNTSYYGSFTASVLLVEGGFSLDYQNGSFTGVTNTPVNTTMNCEKY